MNGVPGPTTPRAVKLAERRELIATKGVELREVGWTTAQIAVALDMAPSTISMYLPVRLRHLSNGELEDRRRAAVFDLDHEHLTAGRRAAWMERFLAHRDMERRAFKRLLADWRRVLRRVRAEHARRQRQARAQLRTEVRTKLAAKKAREQRLRQARSAIRRSLKNPKSLDAPVTLAGEQSPMHETVSAARSDPYDVLRQEELSALLGSLTVDDLARLDEHALERLRERIREAGFAPPSVQRKERQRLREPERHRGSAPSPTRERKSSRHRGRREQQALMAGKRTSRKQRGRWERP